MVCPSGMGRSHRRRKSLNQQLRAMVRIATTVLTKIELDEILASITEQLSLVIDFDRSSVAIFYPERGCLVLRDIYKNRWTNGQKHGEGREIPLDESNVIGWVAIHKEPALRRDITREGKFTETVKEEGLRSDMIVPLVARGKLVGTLNVGSYRRNAFDKEDLELLMNCGNLTCVAIEHSLLLHEAMELGRRYQLLQESANDMIMLVDKRTGRIIEANRKCENILGYTRDQLARKSFFDLFAKEDVFQAKRDFINLLSKKERSFLDRRMMDRWGRIIFVDINASLIEVQRDTLIQIIIHDISQRKMLEQQIILQNRGLQQVNRKLREVDKMKTEFLANISHELRTPLSIILAYAEALQEEDIDSCDRGRFVKIILENGEHLLKLINDLLNLSKLEISGTKLRPTLSHVHDVIRSVWPEMQKKGRERGVELHFEPAENVPAVYFDNNQMAQVVTCLVGNAIKFNEEGGWVRVRTRYRDGEIRIEVQDNGAGIPEVEIPHIFEPFRQVDGSTSRRWGGMGIGLSITKHVVELHGGRLDVKSKEGKGSVFTVILPANSADALVVGSDLERPERT